jgi:hypothetical protein
LPEFKASQAATPAARPVWLQLIFLRTASRALASVANAAAVPGLESSPSGCDAEFGGVPRGQRREQQGGEEWEGGVHAGMSLVV